MIGQRLPAANEPVRFITATFTSPGLGSKGLFSWGLPGACRAIPNIRSDMSRMSQKRCQKGVTTAERSFALLLRVPAHFLLLARG